jgi:peptidoglycan/LPS O-acetylase OafA/YrhL
LVGQRLDQPAQPTKAAKGRIKSLDGLRGVAALIVVFHHILLTVPSLALAYEFTEPRYAHDWLDILTYTPLHLIWDGPAAVVIFFVLSGYVLSVPYAAGKTGGWRSYYPQRLLRLYLPVWGALIFSLIAVTAVQRHYVPGATYFVNLHATAPHGVAQAARNATLLLKTGWLDSPLWSLRFEVAFSVFLPLAVWGGAVCPRLWAVKGAACLAVVVAGWQLHSQLLEYVPMFGFGVILAYEQERFRAVTRRFTQPQWIVITTVSVLLISSYWDLWGLGLGGIAAFGQALSAIGGCGVLVAMRDWPSARRFGEAAPIQWLGKRSFSLYLIHEPIVLTVVFALGGKPNVPLIFAIALPITMVLTEVFYRLVEHPSHLFALAVGRLVKERWPVQPGHGGHRGRLRPGLQEGVATTVEPAPRLPAYRADPGGHRTTTISPPRPPRR